MAVWYYAGFDLRDIGLFTLTIDDNGAGSPLVYTESNFGSQLVAHVDSVASGLTYADLVGELNTAIAAEPITVTFSAASGQYTFTYTGVGTGFDLTFSTVAARVFGFSTTVHTNKASIQSDVRPYYEILGQTTGRSAYSRDYEPSEVASQAISDDGANIMGLARTASPKFLDWRQQFETLPSTFKSVATSAIPWTWEHLFEHCRTVHPILVSDGYDNAWVRLRPEGSAFRPEAQTPDFDEQWHIPLQTVLEARHV